LGAGGYGAGHLGELTQRQYFFYDVVNIVVYGWYFLISVHCDSPRSVSLHSPDPCGVWFTFGQKSDSVLY
jgi:hypothetical protein